MPVIFTPWTMPLEGFGAFRFVCSVLVATWVFIRNVAPRREHYVWRALTVCLAAMILTASYPLAFLANKSDILPDLSMMDFARGWIFAVFLLSLAAVKYCYTISWIDAMSRWILGLCVERFITAFIYNWLFLIIIPDFDAEHPVGYMLICIFSYTLFIGLAALLLAPIFRHSIGTGLENGSENRMLIMLYAASFLALAIISNISMHISEYWIPYLRGRYGNGTGFDYILWFSTSMAGVIATVIFLFQYAIHRTAVLRQETAMLNLLSEQKERQYAALRDNIDFINRKTHDLKHQIAALRLSGDDRRASAIHEVQQALDLYDATANTGSPALDTLITERNFYCSRRGIRMSCMLRGCDWNAIDVVDLFTMLGNALDNACEYVEQFDDPDKRVVSLTAQQHGQLIVISVDNHYEGPKGPRTTSAISFSSDGLPITTKTDKASHGLGLKSIRRIARQYGGDIQVSAIPPIFTLQISLMTRDSSSRQAIHG